MESFFVILGAKMGLWCSSKIIIGFRTHYVRCALLRAAGVVVVVVGGVVVGCG